MRHAAWLFLLVPVLMAARPSTEFGLVTQLNGQPVRFRAADGGSSGMFAAAANVACMPLTGATNIVDGTSKSISPNVLLIVPLTAGNLCIRPSAYSTYWDGGCHSYLPGDENQGVPMAPGVPQYITPDSKATWACFSGDAGSVTVPIWTVQ